jgi:choline dehydrogenase-like flavoprotein
MIIDLAKVQTDPFAGKNFDVCVIGAGVAGISLALNLSKTLNVLLLEAGGFDNSVERISVYEGESVGQNYFDLRASRLRYFGGTSNHWGGDCRPLDELDFEKKSYVENSGWPIRKTDLDPFLPKAESILELSDDSWDPPEGYFEDSIGRSQDIRPIRFKSSPPTRFGQKYRRDIERQANISCLLNANVTEFRLRDDRSRVDHINVSDYSGNSYKVPAGLFVLATGGIENPRLLLNSNRQVSSGLGNENGNVGRFFTDHFYTKAADFILEDHAKVFVEQYPFGDSFKGRLKDQICSWNWLHDSVESIRGQNMDCLSEIRHFFSPTRALMERDQTLNFSLRMQVRTPGHGEATDGKLFIGSEQAINPLSTVTLGTDTDMFGMQRVKLDWQLSDIDIRTLQLAAVRFGETIAGLSIGRLKIVDWMLADPFEYLGDGGHHHSCTTRMGETPENSVVDSNQKVFGIDNLYLAGSSVFSTSGEANPTLTIVQTTLRLAEHVNKL